METAITRNTQRLEHLEAIIDRTQRDFIECGRALLEIQKEELYDKVRGIASFETYIRDRFGMARRTAYQLIDATKAVDNVRSCAQNVPAPANEYQARAIASAPIDQQAHVWQQAVATAPEGKVTAAHVYKIVKGMTNLEPEKPAAGNKDEDSDAVFHLKRWWRKATKKDKQTFLSWVGGAP